MQERIEKPEPEAVDDIDASKAPLMDHLIELRQRLIYAVLAFLAMFCLCFYLAPKIYDILVWPYVWASGSDQVRLIATHFLEEIFTYLKLAMFGAAFLSFPDRRDADLQVRGAGTLQKRAQGISAVSHRHAGFLRAGRGGRLLPRHAGADQIFARPCGGVERGSAGASS